MSDRAHSLTVVLDHDMRVDDLEALVAAIAQFRGVIRVAPNVRDAMTFVAVTRVRHSLRERLWKVLENRDDDDVPGGLR